MPDVVSPRRHSGPARLSYQSTRGEAETLGFEDALLAGLARDGGLYVPTAAPRLSRSEIAAFSGLLYEEATARVASRFTGDAFDPAELRSLTHAAYDGRFAHPACAPLTQIGPNLYALELFRGPTLAFKDFAMLLVGRMFEAVLSRRGRRATVIGATSGDTGSAAIEAFRGLDMVDVFILYPHGRVSEVQRRQMTTPSEPNVHALAIEGDFDACQALVKAMFNDHAFRDAQGLAAVNSINWARVMAQIVYYITAAVSLGAPARPVSFSVPTGNFGDIYAGLMAKRLGAPIERLIIATNENDILHRAMTDGRYARGTVRQTTSPSMDIQVSSNFERALFDAAGRDAAAVRGMMESLRQSGGFEIPAAALASLRGWFDSGRVAEADVARTIAETYAASAYILDPHTAVGVAAAKSAARAAAGGDGDGETPVVCLACAHPAKFPDAVEAAIGQRPPLPPHLADLFERPERATVLPDDLAAVQAHITARSGSTS